MRPITITTGQYGVKFRQVAALYGFCQLLVIADIFQTGFIMGEKVIRFAMVKVAN